MNEIVFSGQTFPCKLRDLSYGQKKLNRAICKSNLLDLRETCLQHDIPFGLAFGTLLGAIREHDFIAHDEDVDVYIIEDHRKNFSAALNGLIKIGFEIVRYEGDVLSISRNGEYIDVYFFRERGAFFKCGKFKIPSIFFITMEPINFLGKEFYTHNTPLDLLIYLYGKNWQTPISGAHANPTSAIYKIKEMLSPYAPKVIKTLFRKVRPIKRI